MTTTLLAPVPDTALSPVLAVRPSPARRPPATGCPIERRALRAGARDLAAALTGIALDDPCCRRRQRAVLASSATVVRTAGAVARRTGDGALGAARGAVTAATPVFAADVSAGAPALALAWTALADALDGVPAGGGHDHPSGELLRCEHRFRTAVGTALVAVPWFLDACSPRERRDLVLAAPRRLRLALRQGEDRWLARRDAVRAAAH
ncbi:hypothetical protein GCU56_14050 [Geodermatophilus sabuli]|uniref:Uncharacterized protein n=1 Tax=Geodermatophilus sabuli TaxID=1564158 RepID=A0A7K3W2U0_9ACTN|nr:hypothetical protein [Geodermatophilus sabuli]NEK58990.1 hypothetical protein [Geodermatophilus sabuli]